MIRLPHNLAAALLGILTAGAAVAGPNEGGVLILHAAPFTGRIGRPICGLVDLSDCSDARVNTPIQNPMAWSVFAAFPEGADPRLLGVAFGIDYKYGTILMDWEACGSSEVEQASWPLSGTGTEITWDVAQAAALTEVYAFLGYGYYEGTTLCLTPHPTQGGWFIDDSDPPVLDAIDDYGCIGFGSNPGYLPCPVAGEVGACCLPGGSCEVSTEEVCTSQGGSWLGSDVSCDPDPCAVPTSGVSWGAVKRQFR